MRITNILKLLQPSVAVLCLQEGCNQDIDMVRLVSHFQDKILGFLKHSIVHRSSSWLSGLDEVECYVVEA